MKEKNKVTVENRNRIALAYLTLARDKKFFKLPEEKRIELIQSALSFGDSVALGIENEFSSTDSRSIAQMMGLKIIGEDGGKNGTLLKRSEYRPKTKEIIVFRDSLGQLMREVAAEDLSDRIMKLLIAHEIFHHLEHTRHGATSNRFKVNLWHMGPISYTVKISNVSEVAAHAFAEKLLDIKLTPEVFDYLTYIFYSAGRTDH